MLNYYLLLPLQLVTTFSAYYCYVRGGGDTFEVKEKRVIAYKVLTLSLSFGGEKTWESGRGHPKNNNNTVLSPGAASYPTVVGLVQKLFPEVIFWGFEPTLRPWPWRYQPKLFTWHSRSCWLINIPSSIKKGYVVQKILSGQIFPAILNRHCVLDLEDSNPKLSHYTPPCDDAPLYQICLQTGLKVQEIWKKVIFEDLSPHCDLDLNLEDRNPTFSYDTLGHDNASSYQVWLHTV